MDLVEKLKKYGIWNRAWSKLREYEKSNPGGETRTDLLYQYAAEISSDIWCETRNKLNKSAGVFWFEKELSSEEKLLYDKMKELKELEILCQKKCANDFLNL